MDKGRMETLRDVLVGVAERGAEFDLSDWAQVSRDDGRAACGTTACAIGWAALDPRLQGEGLHLEAPSNPDPIRDLEHLHETVRDGATLVWPVYLGHRGFHAPMEFFGITTAETLHLFHPSNYDLEDRRNPRAVIERIDALLAAKARGQRRVNENGKA